MNNTFQNYSDPLECIIDHKIYSLNTTSNNSELRRYIYLPCQLNHNWNDGVTVNYK